MDHMRIFNMRTSGKSILLAAGIATSLLASQACFADAASDSVDKINQDLVSSAHRQFKPTYKSPEPKKIKKRQVTLKQLEGHYMPFDRIVNMYESGLISSETAVQYIKTHDIPPSRTK
jgi:hypothetical protein